MTNSSLNRHEKNMIHAFMKKNIDQFFEISDSVVCEVQDIKSKYPDNWKEMVAMTMFTTL